jgi:AsmA protein
MHQTSQRRMKTFLKVFAGLLVLLVIAVGVFLYTFNANDYKEELAEFAENIAGRPISISGNIDISIYPWIGIKVDNVSIENPPGFSNKTFASIGQLDIKIEIKPLLQKRLNIEKLVLHDLAVNFEKNTWGASNWSDLTATSGSAEVESKFGLDGLAIGGVEVTDANLSWLDVNTGKQFNISKMKLVTEAVIKGQPLPITLNAYVKSNQPKWQGKVLVKTRLEFNEDSPVLNAKKLKLVVKAALPSTTLKKVSIAMIADGQVNVQTQKAKLSKARLSVLGLLMTGELDIENVFSKPVIHGPLKVKSFKAQTLAKHLKITPPQMANAQSLKNISLTTLFKTDFDSVHLDNISAKIDETRINGFLHVTGIDRPVVRYNLDVDKIGLHNYRTTGSESDHDEILLPVDFIRTSDLEGTFDIETVTVDDVELTDFHITSNIKNGTLTASPISMLAGESGINATVQLDATEIPQAVFTVTVDNVDANDSINPLLKTIIGDESLRLEGIVNADANLQASGSSLTALNNSMKGTIKVNMDRTIVQGIDIEHASRSVVADYANKNNFKTRATYVPEYKADHKTEFNSLSATFNASNGKLLNNDLLLVSEKVNLNGSGSIDFSNRKLDYFPVIDLNVKDRLDIRDKLRDHPMEYHAHGAFENLSTEFNLDKYELRLGRLLIQDAKARRIRKEKEKSKNSWQRVKG